MPKLERDGEIFILRLDPDDENRFHPDWLAAVEEALDEVEAAGAPAALVTAGSGRFWSNGLDVDWLRAHGDQFAAYLDRVEALLARTLASPVVSVASINGHAFAAGGMWALAHDLRVMRVDRGFFCLPEVDIDMTFSPGMAAFVRARLTPQVAHVAMTTGRRYGGQDALAAGIVDGVAGVDDVLAAAVDLARPLAGKSRSNRGSIKERMYQEALAALRAPTDPARLF
ncbi:MULTISPECIES: enoyl-CoA hydratase-related protein [unclassified Pseudofrankia]|uniref:enoyl-CoA hydratase-related protein n=1 Tax=unclassified Pseudofrankia TaxID=2994372 RepID=UPI0008D9D7A0|nr:MULTISPECIES: enoyl-CoA hydratase-related protein [unclassified Pseudofrankia]MDT3442183.1 enoyl-CoA hydratase-related protein [Pseudofrankia sp. BMG5.37]OHV43632.1 enoyl-CoA hydratase [Pseudofrankia sp. BMG5.36]